MRSLLRPARLLAMVAAPIVWTLHFVLCYVIVSLACAAGLTQPWLLGMDPAQAGIAVVTALALLLLAWIALAKWRTLRRVSQHDPDLDRFFALNALLLCALSTVALVWVAAPTLLLPSCAA